MFNNFLTNLEEKLIFIPLFFQYYLQVGDGGTWNFLPLPGRAFGPGTEKHIRNAS